MNDEYADVMQILHAGIVVHAADTSVTYGNPAAQGILGQSEDQMPGRIAIDPQWYFFDPAGEIMPLNGNLASIFWLQVAKKDP
ncbi:MAG: PAS domain-containing protein [Proteobacteria bacterium]|nr:PAS domain-containing protein [Pseudomonadota bacterium]MBU1610264.1 PAS domain-containing protein [Pseudomonadota bacterium]